jgi:hypothetical protein
MELKDFVRDTLAQIIDGVCAAHTIAGERARRSCPTHRIAFDTRRIDRAVRLRALFRARLNDGLAFK